jgi:hypothetical protein
MSLYTLALFLHVSGAIGAFISLGIWLFGLAALRRARLVAQVRATVWLIMLASPLMVGSVVLIGLAGFRMALSTWGLATSWIAVSLVSVVLIGPLGAFLLDPRMCTIMDMAREVPDGPLPDALIMRSHDPILVTAATTLASMLLGIVFLMTTKPELVTSMLVMGIALFLGLCVSLPFWTARPWQARQPGDHLHSTEADPFLKKTIWTRRW